MKVFARDSRVAGVRLGRALEAVQAADKAPVLTADQARIIKPRFRSMIAGTRTLARALVMAIDAERRGYLSRAPVRESAHGLREADDGEIERWLLAVDAMGPAGIEQALRDAYESMYEQGVAHVRAEIASHFDLKPERALAALASHAIQLSVDVIVAEKMELKKIIRQAFEDGIDPRTLAASIADYFQDGVTRGDRQIDVDDWAILVARTETARAQNAGALNGYEDAGVETIIWMTGNDERVCPYCVALDGKTTRTGEAFAGTNVVAPPLHPNCRCGIVGLNDITKSLVKDTA